MVGKTDSNAVGKWVSGVWKKYEPGTFPGKHNSEKIPAFPHFLAPSRPLSSPPLAPSSRLPPPAPPPPLGPGGYRCWALDGTWGGGWQKHPGLQFCGINSQNDWNLLHRKSNSIKFSNFEQVDVLKTTKSPWIQINTMLTMFFFGPWILALSAPTRSRACQPVTVQIVEIHDSPDPQK